MVSRSPHDPGLPQSEAETPEADAPSSSDAPQIEGHSTHDEEPMTEEQIGELQALSIQANDPQAFSRTLTRGEAAGLIKMLEAALAR